MAEEFRGTPGPWEANSRLTIADTNGEFIADAAQVQFGEGGEYSLDTAEWNARLIAAAPAMLEALQNLVNSFEKHRPKEYWDAARAAITAALGGAK